MTFKLLYRMKVIIVLLLAVAALMIVTEAEIVQRRQWETTLNGGYKPGVGWGGNAGITYTKGGFKGGLTGGYTPGSGWSIGGSLSWKWKRQLEKRDKVEVRPPRSFNQILFRSYFALGYYFSIYMK